jgi:cadmium resistance protein CadD (predicted permease)
VPTVAKLFTRYGSYFVPFVLIGLGVFILVDSHSLENPGLTVLAATIIALSLMMDARDVLET